MGKYYYIFLRTVGREYEPGLPAEQVDGVWLIGKVVGMLGGDDYPRSYMIDYTHALRGPAFGAGEGEDAPPEYEPLGDDGEGRSISYAHIQSPSEPGLPPERTVARFYVPEQGGGRRYSRKQGRRRTGRRQSRKQRRTRRG